MVEQVWPLFAADVRRQRVSRVRGFRHWKWHLDEVYVKINGEMHYLWRAFDQEGEVLESYVTKTRDKAAALKFMKKALKRQGSPEAITTDGLRSYQAAMDELGNAEKQEVGRGANNRVENSHLPFRRRERAMLRFRQMKSLQKFASVHANVHNGVVRATAPVDWRSSLAPPEQCLDAEFWPNSAGPGTWPATRARLTASPFCVGEVKVQLL